MGHISEPALFALCALGQALTLIMVPLRVIARLRVVYRLALEDYLMIIAEILNLGLGAMTLGIIYYGGGKHYQQITPDHAEKGLLLWYMAMITYAIVQTLIKVSIGLLLLRLMANRWQKAIVQACIAATIAAGILVMGYAAGFCTPPNSFWLRNYDQCDAKGYVIALEVHASINVITDLALAIMPAIVLARSSLPRKQKIATAAILAIGTGSGLATVFRIVFTRSIMDLEDFLYSTTWLGICTSLEASLAITAGCLATFRPFFAKVKGRAVRPNESVGADGRLSFSKEMGAETIRGDWDPGLTITYDPDLDEIERAPSINQSRRSSDISLPIQAHKDFEHVPDLDGWVNRKYENDE